MPVLRYHTGSGVYADLPGSIEEVTVSPTEPPVKTDLWIDTDDDTGYIPSSRLGSRNVIRNGDMSIAQRGNGPFTGSVGLDGYAQGWSGGAVSVSRVNQAVGAGSPFLQATISGQAAAGDYMALSMSVENVQTLSGKVVTLSFDAVAASGAPKIGLEFEQYFGAGGSGSPRTTPGTFTLGTTKARYSLTFTVPSAAGGTVGTANDCLYIRFWLSAGSTYASRASNIGIQNNTFSITDVQLEEGSVATSFERLPQQQQLAWCQRYFYRFGAGNPHMTSWANYSRFGFGHANNSLVSSCLIDFPEFMRAQPSMVASAFGTFHLWNGGATGYDATSGPTVDCFSNVNVTLNWGHTSSPFTTGQAVDVMQGTSPAYIDFSAEL